MPLFEATWPDSPSVLLSAFTAGEALHYIRQNYGADMIFQLDELVEIQSSNFLLARRCGRIVPDLQRLSYNLCPESASRVFVVERKPQSAKDSYGGVAQERCVLIIDDIEELTPLLLWHFDYLNENDCQNANLVWEQWSRVRGLFRMYELDTLQPGVLLSYEYCCCTPKTESVAAHHPFQERDFD